MNTDQDSLWTFTLNGTSASFRGNPMTRLLDVLRLFYGLWGTKEGCGEGECGACSVLLDGQVVCSCLVPIFQVAGNSIVTIEGLAQDPLTRPLQEALVAAGGVQCGACTPGILVSLQALLQKHPQPRREEVREALAGNLCRCTGYEGILRAVSHLVAGQQEGELEP